MSVCEKKRARIDSVHVDPQLTPKSDERLSSLMDQALTGKLPVYFGSVPLALIVPFDLDCRPDLHPVGAAAIDTCFQLGQKGDSQCLLAYQRGKWFIVSDHYIILFAALQGLRDYVPCWILGKPQSDLVHDVQGPIAPEDVKKILGLG